MRRRRDFLVPNILSSTLFIFVRKPTRASLAKIPTRLFSLSSNVPRIGVKACTDTVTVEEDEAYISSLVRSSGMT